MQITSVYSYDVHSKSARAIADELGVKIIKHDGSMFKGDAGKTILNWGCSDLPREVRACTIINNENAIRLAVDKLRTFRALKLNPEINLPEWTDDIEVAKTYKGNVYCRTKLQGHDGAGIVLTEAAKVVPARLYTRQIAHPRDLKEYRINIFRDKVVSRQKKVRVKDHKKDYNDAIKTTDGGYGFDLVDAVPLGVIPQAKMAVATLGLDFGGVDIVYYRDKAYVLEVNTAPQLTPFAAKKLGEIIKKHE